MVDFRFCRPRLWLGKSFQIIERTRHKGPAAAILARDQVETIQNMRLILHANLITSLCICVGDSQTTARFRMGSATPLLMSDSHDAYVD